MDNALILIIFQLIATLGSLLIAAFKYREVVEFLCKILLFLVKPVKCIIKWIKLAPKIEKNSEDHKNKIIDLEKSIFDLSAFVKEKLSPNGGSSAVDAIRRIENRQIIHENRQLALLNDTKYGVFFCTTLGYNSWVNRTYARFLGCGTSELLNYGWKRFIRTDELARYSKVWESAFHDGCEFEETVQFVDTHGGRINLHISVSAVQNEKGETVSYIGQVLAL